MKTRTLILFIFFASILISCRREKEDYIDISTVTSIDILKYDRPVESTVYPTKKLSDVQIESFVEKFNKTTISELRIFLPTYQVTVHFIDKSTRTFRTSRRYIKENTDTCLDFGDIDYFEKLYSAGMDN